MKTKRRENNRKHNSVDTMVVVALMFVMSISFISRSRWPTATGGKGKRLIAQIILDPLGLHEGS